MYKILSVDDKQWNVLLYKFPQNVQDIYYTREYYEMHEENGDGIAKAFYYEDENGAGFYPFLVNAIERDWLDDIYYDIENAYGYGGPIVSCNNEKLLKAFERAFNDCCIKNKIVAEFIRFHPLIKNDNIFNENIKILHNRMTVELDLEQGPDQIWKNDIKSKNRNVIRKALKNGLTVELSDDYTVFKEIYYKTMDKVDADNYYYLKDNYYKRIKQNESCILLEVKREEKIIAAAIFMGYKDYFHYHLAGSLREELKYSPNNLLLWEAIKYASNHGFKKMHFGGGLTDSLDDKLFKFKGAFSKEYTDFFIGKRIHNKVIYDKLISEWETKNERKAKLLLQYRL